MALFHKHLWYLALDISGQGKHQAKCMKCGKVTTKPKTLAKVLHQINK